MDPNGNEVKIRKVYILVTNLKGVTRKILWWKIDAKTKPIVGMDKFRNLDLELLQICENDEFYQQPTNDESSETTKSSGREIRRGKLKGAKFERSRDQKLQIKQGN